MMSADVAAPNSKRLLWAGFMAILASGVGFSIRAGILGQWAEQYGFTQTELGAITGGGLTGFGIIILLSALIADKIGYGKLMVTAFAMHLASATLTLAAGAAYASGGKPGLRSWLAVAGGIDVPQVLGSRSTDLKAGFGGHLGRALRKGDELPLGASPLSKEQRGSRRFGLRPPAWEVGEGSTGPVTLRLMAGPECEQFTAASRAASSHSPHCSGSLSTSSGNSRYAFGETDHTPIPRSTYAGSVMGSIFRYRRSSSTTPINTPSK